MARQNANYCMLYIPTQSNFVIEAKTVAIALSMHAKGLPIFLAAFSKGEDVRLPQTVYLVTAARTTVPM